MRAPRTSASGDVRTPDAAAAALASRAETAGGVGLSPVTKPYSLGASKPPP